MKPMLAGKAPENLDDIRYPVLVSPKLDGVRALVLDGAVVGRSLKPIPNRWVQHLFARSGLNGLDGELIVGDPAAPDAFNRSASGVMAHDGEPDVIFYVFDYIGVWTQRAGPHYAKRLEIISKKFGADGTRQRARVKVVRHELCENAAQVSHWEEVYLTLGFEGLMIRDPAGFYKHGRSTTKEGGLLKLKRFEDGEAVVVGMTELMHNANEAQTNALGHLERSSHQANKVGRSIMGALQVRDLKTGVEFEIGAGFTDEDRAWWWKRGWWLQNHKVDGIYWTPVVKYKFQPHGVKDKPRFPVYLGLRNEVDQ